MNDTGKTPWYEVNKGIWLLASIGLGSGVSGGLLQNILFNPAPDRFTGQQGSVLKGKVELLEIGSSSILMRINSLEADSDKTDVKLGDILRSVHRIELNIATLPPKEWQKRIRALEQKAE